MAYSILPNPVLVKMLALCARGVAVWYCRYRPQEPVTVRPLRLKFEIHLS